MKNLVKLQNGVATVSSKEIADNFGKVHRDVLRAINNIQCSDEFRVRNFAQSYYTSEQGKKIPCFNITRDGFAFLCMGFTGNAAAEWKERYIAAFNSMEDYIKKDARDLTLTQSINLTSKKIDDIAMAGSVWGKNGAAIKRHKKMAISEMSNLLDKAQIKLGFDFTEVGK